MKMAQMDVELPRELVERARAAGIDVEAFLSAFYVQWITSEIRKREATDAVRALMERLQEIPDDQRPSLEEIVAEIQAYQNGTNGEA